jgi:hypothetical protein
LPTGIDALLSIILRVFLDDVELWFFSFQRMPQLFQNRKLVDQSCGFALAAEVLLQKPEIILVGDDPVFVEIEAGEDGPEFFFLESNGKKLQCVLNGEYKFPLIHDSLLPPSISLLLMQSLNGYFSKMLFHAKIDQLVIFDGSIVVGVVSKNVFYKIVDLLRVFMQHVREELFYLLLLELFVSVLVEFYQLQVNNLTHTEGQFVVGELEALTFQVGGGVIEGVVESISLILTILSTGIDALLSIILRVFLDYVELWFFSF